MDINIVQSLYHMLLFKLSNSKISLNEFASLCIIISQIISKSHWSVFPNNIREIYDILKSYDQYNNLISDLRLLDTINNFTNEIINLETFYTNFYS